MEQIDVEQILYEHAIRTSIRAPRKQWRSLLNYNRMISGAAVGAVALYSTFAAIGSTHSQSSISGSNVPEVIGTQRDYPYSMPSHHTNVRDEQVRQVPETVVEARL